VSATASGACSRCGRARVAWDYVRWDRCYRCGEPAESQIKWALPFGHVHVWQVLNRPIATVGAVRETFAVWRGGRFLWREDLEEVGIEAFASLIDAPDETTRQRVLGHFIPVLGSPDLLLRLEQGYRSVGRPVARW
jgi:hypothetical protein